MIEIQDIDYDLPTELIADKPLPNREESRLLLVKRYSDIFMHRRFSDITHNLRAGDLLVLNNTRVFKARLLGELGDRKNVEVLLIERLDQYRWKAMVRQSKRIKNGSKIDFRGFEATVGGRLDEVYRELTFTRELTFADIEKIGQTPLPPYIVKKRQALHLPDYNSEDEARYQSVFAEYNGSVAAPTASLHFSEELLSRLRDMGVGTASVTLHVGPGTFKPVEDSIENYRIHREWVSVSAQTVDRVRETQRGGGRVIAVGTTVMRSLETMALQCQGSGDWLAFEGYTELFIKEGFRFRVADALITNFHMPKSTLLLLVMAFGGKETLKNAYRVAVNERYRFLSYGDAMFLY